jgi:hypothetical protein
MKLIEQPCLDCKMVTIRCYLCNSCEHTERARKVFAGENYICGYCQEVENEAFYQEEW